MRFHIFSRGLDIIILVLPCTAQHSMRGDSTYLHRRQLDKAVCSSCAFPHLAYRTVPCSLLPRVLAESYPPRTACIAAARAMTLCPLLTNQPNYHPLLTNQPNYHPPSTTIHSLTAFTTKHHQTPSTTNNQLTSQPHLALHLHSPALCSSAIIPQNEMPVLMHDIMVCVTFAATPAQPQSAAPSPVRFLTRPFLHVPGCTFLHVPARSSLRVPGLPHAFR
jgi:hypothetical protein